MRVGELMGVVLVHPIFYAIVCRSATVCMQKYISMPFFLCFPRNYVGFWLGSIKLIKLSTACYEETKMLKKD